MKMPKSTKFLLLALLLFPATLLQAQFILNGGFEDSTITANDTVPLHWSADQLGANFTTDAHSGDVAMMIWNWYYYVPGWISYGDALSQFSGGGLPISITPDLLTGWYKYDYGENDGGLDSAVCEIFIYSHQNFTGARDTIGRARYKLGPAAQYTPFTVPIIYSMPGIVADTIVLRFISSDSGFCANASSGVCLYFTVDDVEVSTTTGLREPLAPEALVQLYPSPSTAGFSIKVAESVAYPLALKLYALDGRQVFAGSIAAPSSTEINPALPAGAYLWEMTDANGKTHAGKWHKI